ncbi:MAG: SDR family oxidoreductase [Blastocatellia bacterium]|nr:SDR family oxidoreductase [Blastocatellia bacterium]
MKRISPTLNPEPGFLILGASSAMARAIAAGLAQEGYGLYLAGRDVADLESTAADLQLRYGVPVFSGPFDAIGTATHQAFFQTVIETLPALKGVVVAFGTMTEQTEAERDFPAAEAMIASNFTGAVSILTHVANYFESKGTGVIVGITSVAGDRGRKSNYVYGSAKGALSLFLQGLRNRMFHCGVRVITVKPGFVDTAMTYGLKLPPIVAPPEVVARDICRAVKGSADVVYTPFFWRYIMLVIKLLPEFVFKRLKL